MKAIPTYYGGCRFRSRLEARWAAFFDLAALTWDYEPIDLNGWTPDFSLSVAGETVYAEVKPVQLSFIEGIGPAGPEYSPDFEKARAHCQTHWILLLGVRPSEHSDYFSIGNLMDPPQSARVGWLEVHDLLRVKDAQTLWRIAGAQTQWRPAA